MPQIDLRKNKHLSFKDGVVELNDVLFLHQENSGQHQFDYLLGNKSITQESLRAFNQNMRKNIRYSEVKEIPYKHVIFPSKPYVFRKEFQDIGLKISKIGVEEMYSQENVYFPGLDTDDYYLDDTHVNHRGLLKILSNLAKELLSIELPEGRFNFEESIGDLGRMCGKGPIYKEKLTAFEGQKEKFRLDLNFTLQNALKGNSGHLDVNVNSRALLKKRLLVFGDSFFRSSLPLVNKIFEEVIYFRCPFIIQEIANIIEPDVIFTGNAERYLVNVPNAKETPPYFFNYLSTGFNPSTLVASDIKAASAIFSGRESKEYKEFKKSIR